MLLSCSLCLYSEGFRGNFQIYQSIWKCTNYFNDDTIPSGKVNIITHINRKQNQQHFKALWASAGKYCHSRSFTTKGHLL